jgi:hypothetical protein
MGKIPFKYLNILGGFFPNTGYWRKDKGEGYTWQEDEEEDVVSYWINLREGEDTQAETCSEE